MILFGLMEIASAWCLVASTFPWMENRLADGVSRWPEKEVQKTATRQTREQGCNRQEFARGYLVLDKILTLGLP